jgi:hypothetical protein
MENEYLNIYKYYYSITQFLNTLAAFKFMLYICLILIFYALFN